MSLRSEFFDNIISIYGLDVKEEESTNSFFNEICSQLENNFLGDEESSEPIKFNCIDYLDSYSIKSKGENPVEFFLQGPDNRVLCVRKLIVVNENVSPGIYVVDEDKKEKKIIFTGSFGDSKEEPDLVPYPELLLAIAVLKPIYETKEELGSLASIFEVFGAFVIDFSETVNSSVICDCGLLYANQRNCFSFDWHNDVSHALRKKKENIPEEALLAYLCALRESTTVDVAFCKLYRVLEVLFAGLFKNKISDAPLDKVIALIHSLQSSSELKILSDLLVGSSASFRFSRDDFNSLFGEYRPQNKNYEKIGKWLDDNQRVGNAPVALIVYYVRCALVHSKMNEKEPFLMGPFSEAQERALGNLVEDIRDIVKELLFE